jgi:hypothetical protein
VVIPPSKAMREELEEAQRVIQYERYMRVADTPLELVRDLAQYYALSATLLSSAIAESRTGCRSGGYQGYDCGVRSPQ